MASGIYIDDIFIGVTWHTVDVYFDVIRKVIDSGQSRRLLLPAEGELISILITPTTRLRSTVDMGDPGAAKSIEKLVSENPFGNFPAMARDVLDADSRHWETIRRTNLGTAIDALDKPDS